MELLDLLESQDGLIPLDHPRLGEVNLNKLLGIVKWEPPMSAELAGMAEGLFPSFVRKTDQERAQNLKNEIFGFDDALTPFDCENIPLDALEAMRDRGDIVWDQETSKWMRVQRGKGDPNAQYEVTMKLDGSSMTVFARLNGGEVQSGVCSRNLQLKVNEANAENSFVKVAIQSGLLKALEELAVEDVQLAVQGELMGPGIQGNRELLTSFQMFVFEMQDLSTGLNLTPTERKAMFDQLVARGVNIKHVPVIAYSANLLDTLGISTMEQLLKFAEGPSLKHPIREGLVYKRLDGQFSFKTISNRYLEKEKD